MIPMLLAMQGLPAAPAPRKQAPLAAPVEANGPRAHYMRARVKITDGKTVIESCDRQDSALLSVLTNANALLIRPPGDVARASGHVVDYIEI